MRQLSVLFACLLAVATVGSSAELYVAKDGSDGNPGTKDKPFATLNRARDAIRAAKPAKPTAVLVREGMYYLSEALSLGPEDSGAAYEACGGEEVVLSGGRVVTGWKPYKDRIWQCDLKPLGLGGLRFRQLFYNGKRQTAARVPNVDPEHPRSGGWAYVPRTLSIPGYDPAKHDRRWKEYNNPFLKSHMTYDSAVIDPTRWSDPTRAEVSIFPWQCWNNNIVPVQAIDTETHEITLDGKGATYKIIRGNRFFVQNVFEELDAPGEWHLDPKSSTLYFLPPDDDPTKGTVVVPVLDSIVSIRGTKDAPVRHVRIAGFRMQSCRGTAVVLRAAENCVIAGSVFTNTGAQAVAVGRDCRNNRVVGNDVTATGKTGLSASGTGNVIDNNHVHHFSEIHRNYPGISIGGRKNVASHNLVHDGPRRGISFRGGENLVEYNKVHHVNFEANDSCIIGMFCGGSYEKAMANVGNVIRYNHVSDSIGYGMRKPGQWASPCHTYGIRMDDLTSGVTVFGNIIVRTVSGAVQIHSGKDNLIENNIMVDASRAQVCFSNNLAAEKNIQSDMSGNRFVRNIVCYRDSDARLFSVGGFTEKMIEESDYNVYFAGGKAPIIRTLPDTTPAESFAKWKAFGYEAHSVVADPLFVDPEHNDYRLKPESPALRLGFKPIPVDKIGLYESPDRATWPVDEQWNTQREELLLNTPPAPQ